MNLEKLKQFMLQGHFTDIESWNERRELAKEQFSKKEISALDASGFIKTLMKKHRRKMVIKNEE